MGFLENHSNMRGYWCFLVSDHFQAQIHKKTKMLLHICCHYQQAGQLAFTELSDLCCNRLHVTAIK